METRAHLQMERSGGIPFLWGICFPHIGSTTGLATSTTTDGLPLGASSAIWDHTVLPVTHST